MTVDSVRRVTTSDTHSALSVHQNASRIVVVLMIRVTCVYVYTNCVGELVLTVRAGATRQQANNHGEFIVVKYLTPTFV